MYVCYIDVYYNTTLEVLIITVFILLILVKTRLPWVHIFLVDPYCHILYINPGFSGFTPGRKCKIFLIPGFEKRCTANVTRFSLKKDFSIFHDIGTSRVTFFDKVYIT